MLYTPNTMREKIREWEGKVLTGLFFATTVVFSGANTTTRVLETKNYEWEAEAYAMYADGLRDLAAEFPHLLRQQGTTKADCPWVPKTRFERSILAAVVQAKAPDFDPVKEMDERREYARNAYFTKLAKKKDFTLEGWKQR